MLELLECILPIVLSVLSVKCGYCDCITIVIITSLIVQYHCPYLQAAITLIMVLYFKRL